MRQYLTLVHLLLLSIGTFAQTSVKPNNHIGLHHAFIQSMMQAQASHSVKKAGNKEYVLAQSTRDNSKDILNDSVRVLYSSIDSSVYDYNMMLYPYNYPYNFSPMFNYLGRFTTPEVFFSEYFHWTIDPNNLVYGFYQKESRSYNSSQCIVKDTMLYTDSSFIPNNTFINHFNTANIIDKAECYVYSSGKSDSNTRQFFSYNTGNYLTEDSTYMYVSGTWHIVSKTYYTYNVTNDLVQIDNYTNPADSTHTKPLTEQYKYVNTFDGSHRMLTVLINENDGKVLAPYVVDTFSYTSAYSFHTSWKEYQYDGINKYWAPMTYMTKHINLNGVPDTVNIKTFDSLTNKWVPSQRYIMRYDSLNNPDSLLDYEYYFTYFPPKPNFTTVYYYKINSPSGINNIVATPYNINAYPNPAKENIFIDITGNIRSELYVSLVDMLGHTCITQSVKAINGVQPFSVSSLAPGTYLFTIKNKSGQLLHRQLIIKE